jgi:hypothetical protein
MRTFAALLLFTLLFSFSLKTAMAATETITGEVIDSFCYATKDSQGQEHSQCASSCIKAGVPVAILTVDGKMYFPLREDHKPANSLYEKLGGTRVKTTGVVYEKNGVKFIVVNSVEPVK